MDVNPAPAPGPATTGHHPVRPARPQASAPTANHGSVRQPGATTSTSANTDQSQAVQGSLVSSGDLQKAEQLKALISDRNVRLSTYHDDASGRNVLEIRDQDTGDVVGQYPSEELLRLSAALREPFVDQSA